MNDGLDSIGPEHPIAWASASATILILQLQASKMLHKTHAWNQAVKMAVTARQPGVLVHFTIRSPVVAAWILFYGYY